MDGYIRKPNYIHDVSNIYSENLRKINFHKYSLNGNDEIYSLDLLRDIYSTNPSLFLNTRDELLLRGFEIELENESSLFPRALKHENNFFLYVNPTDDHSTKFNTINFHRLGLGNFIRDMKVSSDKFFHLIPINNFKYLNPDIELKFLHAQFRRRDFVVYGKEEIESIISATKFSSSVPEPIEYQSKIDDWEDEPEIISENEYSEISQPIIENQALSNEEIQFSRGRDTIINKELYSIPIDHLDLSTRSYNALRRNGVHTIGDLLEHTEEDLYRFRNLGKQSVEEILSKKKSYFEDTVIKTFVDEIQYVEAQDKDEETEDSSIQIQDLAEETDGPNIKIQVNDRSIFQIHDLSTKKLTIADYFGQSKFNLFMDFCVKKGLVYLEELTEEIIDEYKQYRGVGKVKVDQIDRKIQEVSEEIEFYSNHVPKKVLKSSLFKYDTYNFDLHECKVNELLELLNYDNKLDVNLLVSEIYDKDIYKLDLENKDKEILNELSEFLTCLKTPTEIIHVFEEGLSERDALILKRRYKDRFTLREIGYEVGITHERVRQVLGKIKRKFQQYSRHENLKESILLTLISYDYPNLPQIYFKDFAYFLDNEYLYVMNLVLEDNLFHFEKGYEIVFISYNSKFKFISELNNIAEQLPDIFVLDDVEFLFNNKYFNNEPKLLESFLNINGYKKNGKIYSKSRLTLEKMMVLLFRRDLPKRVKITDETYELIVKLAKTKYNFKIDNPILSVKNALHASEEFILVSGNTFQLFDIEDYDLDILDTTIDYITEKLLKRNPINIEEVFTYFEEDLKLQGINEKHHLYSVLKYLHGDEFDFGRGNTLNIYTKNSEKVPEISLLIEYMRERGGICTRADIKNRFRWSNQKIMLMTAGTKKIISWGTHTFRLTGDWITSVAIQEVGKILSSAFDRNGYITQGQLYESALFNSILSKFISNEKIDSSEKFRSTFRNYFKELKDLQVLILPVGATLTIDDIVLKEFPNGASWDALYRFITENLHYGTMSGNEIIEELKHNETLIEVDLRVYYPKNKINIDSNTIEFLLNYIKKERGEQPYIVLKKLTGYRSTLPEINLEWTPHLIKEILLKNGYKELDISNNDYRTDQLILVEQDSDLTSIDELVFYLLKNEYEDSMHESFVAEYLENKGVIYRKTSFKRNELPKSIYISSELINVDDNGRVRLAGETNFT